MGFRHTTFTDVHIGTQTCSSGLGSCTFTRSLNVVKLCTQWVNLPENCSCFNRSVLWIKDNIYHSINMRDYCLYLVAIWHIVLSWFIIGYYNLHVFLSHRQSDTNMRIALTIIVQSLLCLLYVFDCLTCMTFYEKYETDR